MRPEAGAAMRAGWPRLAALPLAWRSACLATALVWLGLIVLFREEWAAMAGQWWNSSTYNHILLVPAILAWLVVQRAPQLALLRPQPWWPGLVLAAGAMLVWVLGAFAGLTIAQELGAVGMLIAAALALNGPRVGAALAFPLAYMLLLVPFGDELVPPLQMVTAAITIALVHASGIPASIDGVFIATPVGLFEVAEACSGVKFLIAMIAFGLLVGNVCFVGWKRRVAFMAVCVTVPILANGVRAWGTIFAAQYVGVEAAAGFDHIVYGWIFFAIVIALVLALAWRFFDRPLDDPGVDAGAINASPLLDRLAGLRIGTAPALIVLAALALGGQAWAFAADRVVAPLPRQVFLPEVTGWTRVDYRPAVWWEPRAAGADHRLLGSYADAAGNRVDVFLALYDSQREGKEAGGFGEGALTANTGWAWQSPGPQAGMARSDRLLALGRVERLAFTWYRSGGLLTGSNARLKLANITDRLLLRARPTATLILSAEERPGHPAEAAIAAFRRSTGPVAAWMDRVAGVR